MVQALFKSTSLILQEHQDASEDECANMIKETVSLLNHIRSCQYLPNINTVEKMDELQKLNTDLISILDEYFKINIWV